MAYKVLIVEDQKIPRQLFELFLRQSEDYELLYSIESAAMAHIYCDRYPVDLILMDAVMSDGSNGLSAAARIKKSHPEIKIILVTSMPEVSFIQRAKEIGIESFWYKEAAEDALMSVMERTMAGESVYPKEAPCVPLGNAKSTEFTKKRA